MVPSVVIVTNPMSCQLSALAKVRRLVSMPALGEGPDLFSLAVAPPFENSGFALHSFLNGGIYHQW
jgi:hypothetical protein